MCVHVVNRGNHRDEVFRKRGDYEAFLTLMEEACQRLPMRILAYCLMPNHFHLVLWPFGDADLGRWMQWLMTAHVRRYHRHYGTDGHVWQGRFKAFPIQQDEHLLTVLRYVEKNPLRAKLVTRAEDWPWSSLAPWSRGRPPEFFASSPLDRPADWLRHVNEPDDRTELEALRRCASRGTPWGNPNWVADVARRLGLQPTLRDRGRPNAKKGTVPFPARKT